MKRFMKTPCSELLSQSHLTLTEDHSIFLDNENGELSEITLSDMNISVYKSDDCTVGIWLQDEYTVCLVADTTSYPFFS